VSAGPADRRPPILAGDRVALRPLRVDDRAAMRAFLAEPEVARWWGTAGPDGAVDELFGDAEAVVFAIELNGVVVGAIQYTEENEPDYRHAGIDMFVGTAYQNRGLGSDALRTLARHLFEERGHHRLTIDPAAANRRAIHVYQGVGFRPVGLMRQYERGPDGSWHDGLLLDMLAGELKPGGGRPGSESASAPERPGREPRGR
jgi:aminoglycoside 6'-N-acetyltransferase